MKSSEIKPEEKSPVWVNCRDCGHEWVWIYTPMMASDLKNFGRVYCPMCVSKKVDMGRKPRAVDLSADVGKTPQQIVTEWLLSGDTGTSSESLAAEFMGVQKKGPFGISPPADPSDLGRCLRLIARVPDVRRCVDTLAEKHEGWRRAATVWNEISASMEREVGIDWSKGTSAPETYHLMRQAGL